jgi:hypothetical protein
VASKKKSNAQKVAAIATIGMPQPIQKLATSKFGSMILIAVGAALVATGAISVSWQGGKPSVTVNQERADELKREVRATAVMAAERIEAERAKIGPR